MAKIFTGLAQVNHEYFELRSVIRARRADQDERDGESARVNP
jgi:hypothetical protein